MAACFIMRCAHLDEMAACFIMRCAHLDEMAACFIMRCAHLDEIAACALVFRMSERETARGIPACNGSA